eukprot:superscaffoldBa00000709_g6699
MDPADKLGEVLHTIQCLVNYCSSTSTSGLLAFSLSTSQPTNLQHASHQHDSLQPASQPTLWPASLQPASQTARNQSALQSIRLRSLKELSQLPNTESPLHSTTTEAQPVSGPSATFADIQPVPEPSAASANVQPDVQSAVSADPQPDLPDHQLSVVADAQVDLQLPASCSALQRSACPAPCPDPQPLITADTSTALQLLVFGPVLQTPDAYPGACPDLLTSKAAQPTSLTSRAVLPICPTFWLTSRAVLPMSMVSRAVLPTLLASRTAPLVWLSSCLSSRAAYVASIQAVICYIHWPHPLVSCSASALPPNRPPEVSCSVPSSSQAVHLRSPAPFFSSQATYL